MPVSRANIDEAEVARFAALASKWWDANGEFRPLHLLGRPRLAFIKDQMIGHFGKPVSEISDDLGVPLPLQGLKILDIGCGGGLVCEPLCRMGAQVWGIDPAMDNIKAAKTHACIDELPITYRAMTVEDMAETGTVFDAVISLEVIEHVPDQKAFLGECARLVRPGGMFILSTLNRTLKSYALAIVAAEYILDWVPRGTHDWQRFVSPDEMSTMLLSCGMREPTFNGLSYDPIGDIWQLSKDFSVNYLAASTKPEAIA